MRYIVFFLFIISGSRVYAQNWELFPYDSVYFINPNNHKDELIPVVKSSDPGYILEGIYIYNESFMTRPDDFVGTTINNYPENERHFFGNSMEQSSGIFKFKSSFLNDVIEIDMSAPLHQSDTQMIQYNTGETYYLNTYVDSIYFDPILNDTLKSIQLILLDSLYTEEVFTEEVYSPYHVINCVGPIFKTIITSENIRILIGKITGVREIPSLGMYPRSKMYTYYKTVDEIKSILSQPVLLPGDVFEVHMSDENFAFQTLEEYRSKTKITSYTIDAASETINYTAEYWKKDISDPTPVLTYNSAKLISMNYGFDNYIFNGFNKNKNNFEYVLRMDSEWGYPVLTPSGQGTTLTSGVPVKFCHLHNIGELNVYSSMLNKRLYVECISYSNINGVENGTSNNLGIESSLSFPLQVVNKSGLLIFNKAIEGHVQLYSIDGKQVLNQYIESPIQTIALPELTDGIYFLRMDAQQDIIKVPIWF